MKRDRTIRMIGLTIALSALLACGKGDDGPKITKTDRDGDGLTNAEEAAIGSNPDAADTDRDTWDDGIEVDNHTDPLDGFDHPYEGGWAIDPCRDETYGSSNTPGSVAEQFSLMDQHGDPVRLHDFCDRVVVLASAAEWCQPCQTEAVFLQGMYDKYKDDGLMVLTLLGEDVDSRPPSQEELSTWASAFGVTHPVLQDTSFTVTVAFTGLVSNNLPANHLLERGSIVHSVNQPEVTEAEIVELLGL